MRGAQHMPILCFHSKIRNAVTLDRDGIADASLKAAL
jgi:hypothetical protein